MKANGKCIIAITHDDRYFSSADKILKMEMGNIVYIDSNSSIEDAM
jgi:ABC-type siderophore export system fused ATPase/permease subunit